MIIPMKKMVLIALREDEDALMRELQRQGCIEVIPPDDNEGDLNADLFSGIDDKLKRLSDAEQIAAPYRKKPSLLSPLPEVEESVLSDMSEREKGFDVAEKLHSLAEEAHNIQAEIAKREQLISQLTPLYDFDIPLESFRGTAHTSVLFGKIPNEAVHELESEGLAFEISPCDKKSSYIVVYIYKDEKDESTELLQGLGYTAIAVPDMEGTAHDITARLNKEIYKLNSDLEENREKTSEIAKETDSLLLSIDSINVEYDRLRVMADLLKSEKAFILTAWICEDDTEKAEEIIREKTDGAYYIEFSDPAEDDNPPTVVHNPQPFSPFESVTNMYSPPSYRGLDASPHMAPFYMLFFGMMLGDVGYGLLLFIGAMLLVKLKKPAEGMKKATEMFMWSGLATVICGFLFGSFFGMDIDTVLGTKDVFPLIMDPMVSVTEMLILSFGLGLLHMIYGLCLKIYLCMKHGDVQAAIFDNLSWIFILLGGIGAVVIPKPYSYIPLMMLILGLGLILIFGGREKKGIMKIFGGLGSLYNITSWLSDTVSYARVFAIGLVGVSMGQVFNLLGGMVAGAGHGAVKIITVLFAAVILVALHLFSLFINTLSAFAHTSRLQYVEFFGKFYEAGGRVFSPLCINTKNVRVKRTENVSSDGK